MYRSIFLKKSFLLEKIYVKTKILLSKYLIKVILLRLLTKRLCRIMENLLNDARKLKNNNLKNDGIFSVAVNHEKQVDNIFKRLVASNSRSWKPVGTRPSIMSGFWKFHKYIFYNCPLSWPILSAFNTRTYKLPKFLVPM